MKWLLKSGLCLALGWAAARSDAQEISWRPAADGGAHRAIVPAVGQSSGPQRVQPVVGLSRPVPLSAAPGPAAGPGIGLARPTPLVRGQSAEERPMPSGPALGEGKILTAPPPRAVSIGTDSGIPNANSFSAPAPQPTAPPANAPGLTPRPFEGGSIWGHSVPFGPSGPSVVGDGADCGCGPDSCGIGCCPTTGCGLGDCFGCFGGRDRCANGCFWVNADYLLWFTHSQRPVPLVTVSPAGTPRAIAGVLGFPTTSTELQNFDNDPRSGGRFQLGFWLPHCCDWGVDTSFFFLGTRSNTFVLGGGGDPIIARPLVDANSGSEIAQLVAFPNVVTGSVMVHQFSKFWGMDTNLRKRLCCGCNWWFDVTGGYRYLDLNEGLAITENLNVLNPDGSFRGNINVHDSFQTRNRFNGGQLGVAGSWNFCNRWSLGGSVKVALGNMNQTVDINGTTTFTGFATPLDINGTRNGGILALPTNIGSFNRDTFAVVPEVGVKVGYDVTDHLRLYVGYDFIYMSDVVRPNDQVDRVINRSQIPNVTVPGTPPLVGTARPQVLFRTSDFWAQGINFGFQYRY